MSDVKKRPIRMTSLNGKWFTNGLHAAGVATLFLILCHLYPVTRENTCRLKLSVSVGQQRKEGRLCLNCLNSSLCKSQRINLKGTKARYKISTDYEYFESCESRKATCVVS